MASQKRSKTVAADRSALEKRLRAGEIMFSDVHDMMQAEHGETTEIARAHAAHKSKRGPKPTRKLSSVRRVAGPMKIRRALAALAPEHADLILHEYGFDGEWAMQEIGTAEASLIDSAVRLVRHERRPEEE